MESLTPENFDFFYVDRLGRMVVLFRVNAFGFAKFGFSMFLNIFL